MHGINNKYKFLSRPRRFGKSLFVSTLKAICQGDKELFKNTWIYTSNYDWQKYPVIHLSFNELKNSTTEILEKEISWKLAKIAQSYHISIEGPSLQDQLIDLIEKLTGLNDSYSNRVVVLIDEYDSPFINVKEPTIKESNKKVISDFLTVIKSCSEKDQVKLEFVTGVSSYYFKDCHSGPNNLTDISMYEDFATVTGYRDKDLFGKELPDGTIENAIFYDRIKEITEAKYIEEYDQELPDGELQAGINRLQQDIRSWYNGYRFYPLKKPNFDNDNFYIQQNATKWRDIAVYNPTSVLHFLNSGEFKNYWIQTGPSNFVVTNAQKSIELDFDIDSMPIHVSEDTLIASGDAMTNIGSFYQGGYLTMLYKTPADAIRQHLAKRSKLDESMEDEPTEATVTVDFPNKEIRASFHKQILNEFGKVVKLSKNSVEIIFWKKQQPKI